MSRPLAPWRSSTTSQTVSGIVTSTLATVIARYARARSSSRRSASTYSHSVTAQSPTIAIRTSPASWCPRSAVEIGAAVARSEEHTSELQSHVNLVCRLLLEKKKKKKRQLLTEKKKKNKKK